MNGEKPREDARDQEDRATRPCFYRYLTPEDMLRIRSGAPLVSPGRLLGALFIEASGETVRKGVRVELGRGFCLHRATK
jgi:hypothetical protein